jgi:hypothetical protein
VSKASLGTIFFCILLPTKKLIYRFMETKKIQILKEVVRDVLIVLGLAMVVVAPIAFVLFVMYVQSIIFG